MERLQVQISRLAAVCRFVPYYPYPPYPVCSPSPALARYSLQPYQLYRFSFLIILLFFRLIGAEVLSLYNREY
jgi:hypothetical protein